MENVIHSNIATGTNETSKNELKLPRRAIFRQLMMGTISNCTLLMIGMDLTFAAVAYHTIVFATDGKALTEEQFSWIASAFALTGPIGGILTILIFDRFGRKNTLYLINIFELVGWTIIATANTSNPQHMFAQILVGRLINGLAYGLSVGPCSIYIAEITHASIRGRVLTLATIINTLGTLLVYILGYFMPTGWRTIAAIGAILSLLSVIGIFFICESPRWLVTRERMIDAANTMSYLYGGTSKVDHNDPDGQSADLESIIAEHALTIDDKNETIMQTLMRPEVYKPLAIIFCLFLFQQGTGVHLIVVYAVKFFLEAGVEVNPFLCSVGVGVVRVLAALVAGNVFDTFGRKVPASVSCAIMAISTFAIGTYLSSGSTFAPWLPIVGILVHVCMGNVGMCVIPWLYMGEIFPQKLRALSSGISAIFMNIFSFSMIKCYPTMIEVMGNNNIFFFFGCMSLLAVFFIVYVLPETKNRTIEDIQNSFRKIK